MRHGRGIRADTSSEEIHSREGSHSEEEESDLCHAVDMKVVAEQDLIGHPLFVVTLPLFKDLVPKVDRIREEETDFVRIDRGLRIGLQISRGVLDVNVTLARK